MLSPEERLEQIMKVLDELEELSSTMPVVVEGLKDVEALRRVGIERNVITLGRGSTLFTFCEEVSRSTKEVVVLTDWDRKGGRLARTLK
ncbi:MAG TPA: toprim domain-containing protein, partial [Thermoplasmata archaeon]|nr:toprim domain-containing protein [Thermoplasmata archaeon]